MQFFSQRCLNSYIDSFIDNFKKIKQNKGKQTKVEEVAVKFITVSVGNLHFQAKKYSTVLEATRTCKQITKSASTQGEMVLDRPERRDDNK